MRTLYFPAFCNGFIFNSLLTYQTLTSEDNFHHKSSCSNVRDIHYFILSSAGLQDILQYLYYWTACKSMYIIKETEVCIE